MKFGFDKYVDLEEYPNPYPLPNGKVGAEDLPRTYNELSKYNVYGFLFKKHLDYQEHGFGHDTVDNLVKSSEKFMYAILLRDKKAFGRLSDENYYKLSDTIINAVRNKQAKILLSHLFEGDFKKTDLNEIEALNKFAIKYNFQKDDILVLSNNLKWNYEEPENAIFTVKTCNYFLLNPWFIKEDLLDESNDQALRIAFEDRRRYVTTYPKPKRFLSLNRRPRTHRIVLFAEIAKDPQLRDATVLSMGSRNLDANQAADKNHWARQYDNPWMTLYDAFIADDYKYNKKSGLDFIESYDNNEDYFVDSNLNYNLAFNLNETLHLNTFVNVFTETLFEEDTIFLSEKIFKPLFCCQPFIVFGNPGTLEELQKIGFKTFGDFWDESYDKEIDFTKRLEKIIGIMKDLVKKTPTELLKITQQMDSILEHNYQHMIQSSRAEVFILKQILNEQFN
jgi:hypothetical protein